MLKMEMPVFKIRSSQIYKIMGWSGLTDKQKAEMKKLQDRKADPGQKPLTPKMEDELKRLIEKSRECSLPTACKTYLKEWYAENMYKDRVEIDSKYTRKGNLQEDLAIDFTAAMSGLMVLNKNTVPYENEWITGEPDIIAKSKGVPSKTMDTKCKWNSTTFLEAVTSNSIDPAYEWQGRGYMALVGVNEHVVCHCLLDTPEEANYGEFVSYSEVPQEWRYFTQTIYRDDAKEGAIRKRVEECRNWLHNYDREIREKLGLLK